MQCLAPPYVTEDLLKIIWIQRLPVQLQSFLRVSKEELSKLSSLADTLHESVIFGEVSVLDKEDVATTSCARLEKKVDELAEVVNKLTVSNSSHSDRRKYFHSSTAFNNKYCWYHANFGEKAHKCIFPCQFMKKNAKNAHAGH